MNHFLLQTWKTKKFQQLSVNELYSLMQLRINVFMNEQQCFYPELDDFDQHPDTLHIFIKNNTKNTHNNKKIVAYARILPRHTRYHDAISIGRVVVDKQIRKQAIGHQLIKQCLDVCQRNFPEEAIKISSQTHLEHFYQQHHFKRITDDYLEDNIPHLGMQYTPST